MRRSLCYLVLLIICAVPAAAVGQKRTFQKPIHPDTLPTIIQSWRLPASLAPYVTNNYTPRMNLTGATLFVYDHHGRRLVAADALSGKVKWHKPVPSKSDKAFAFTPLVYKSRVFVACDGRLYSFDALTGRPKWKLGLKGIGVNGLARAKHRLFIPMIKTSGKKADSGVVVWAVDSRLARVEWTKKFPGTLGFMEASSDAAYYIGNTGAVLALTVDRGDPLWQVRVKGQVLRKPIRHKKILYVATRRKKSGWEGTGIFAVDLKKGKILWQSKLASPRSRIFMYGKQLAAVDGTGKLTVFDSNGKKETQLKLNFADLPTTLEAASVGKRVFVFSSHTDGHGYVWLVDMERKRVLTAANALSLGARSMLPAAKMLFMDGEDGSVYAFRLDKSGRPKRLSVPEPEFAKEILDNMNDASALVEGLSSKLAGLGAKALPASEAALTSENPYKVFVAAEAIGFLGARRSVPALLKAVKRLGAVKLGPEAKIDPLIPVLVALAEIRDGKAIASLKGLLTNPGQDHMRRRYAYVALGSIGTPAALAPLWTYRAGHQVATTRWAPEAISPSLAYEVEQDILPVTADTWPADVRNVTSKTTQVKEGLIYTAALSPYLGSYNDVWIGPSDLSGMIKTPIFTGMTRAEIKPNKRLRFKGFTVTEDHKATLTMEMEIAEGKWAAAKPVLFELKALRADRDRDGLPDNVERRLHLCVINEDCDGDGVLDSEDLNPLASRKLKLTVEQELFREAFFTYYSFLKRRGLVVVDPGDGPSYELYGRQDPILSLRRRTVERFRRDVGLHATDFVTFGGPYPEGGGSGDALPDVAWNKRKTVATVGMDIIRSSENAVAYNVTLKKVGKNWVVSRLYRVWTTNK